MTDAGGWGLRSLLAALAVALAAVLPAQDTLKVENVEGFDGFYKPGKWIPIFATIDNRPGKSGTKPEDFSGQLSLTSPVEGSDPPAVRFSRFVEVPANSTKRYILYAKLTDTVGTQKTAPPRLVLYNQDGKRVSDYALNINPVMPGKLLMVTLSDGFPRASLPMWRNGLDSLISAKISPKVFPDHWAALDAVDVLMIPAWPDTMRPESVQAIREWVGMGGTLVMVGGQDAATYVDPAVKDMLPVDILSSAVLREKGFGEFEVDKTAASVDSKSGDRAYVIAVGAPKSGATVWASVGGVPLMTTRPLGLGRVVFFATDLQSSSPALEAKLAPAWLSQVPMGNMADASYEFPEALQGLKQLTGRAARPPNQFLIILICIAYTVVVGPLNFAVLGRRKKLEWAWFTVPAIVAVFFVLIYGIGRLTKGGSSIVRELRLEEIASGQKEGRATTITSSFVSAPGTHNLIPTAPRGTIGEPLQWVKDDPLRARAVSLLTGLSGGGGASGDAPVFSYDNRANHVYLQGWSMGTYDPRTFIGRAPAAPSGTIDSDLKWDDYRISGTITNRTGHAFSQSWIIVGKDAYPVGMLDNGKSWTADTTRQLRGGFGTDQKWLSAPDVIESKRVESPQNDIEIGDHNFFEAARATYFPRISGNLLPPRAGEAWFVGIRDEPRLADSISSISPDVVSRRVVTMARLPLAAPRAFKVSGPYLGLRLLGYDAAGPMKSETFNFEAEGRLVAHNSLAVFCAELPFADPRLKVSRLVLDVTASQRDDNDIRFFAYKFAPSPDWVEVTPGRPIANDNMAMPGNGRLLFRMEVTPNANVQRGYYGNEPRISDIAVTLEGTTE